MLPPFATSPRVTAQSWPCATSTSKCALANYWRCSVLMARARQRWYGCFSAWRVRMLAASRSLAPIRMEEECSLVLGPCCRWVVCRRHCACANTSTCSRPTIPPPLPLQETFQIAGIEDIKNRPFGELSGGQKQRVLFGIAICGNPDLLFLDEPTV